MKPILGYENEYLINNLGQIYRQGRSAPLKHVVNPKNGYVYASLWKNNRGKSFSIHRLVATHFIPNPDNKPEVNHIDSDRRNPVESNLEWSTHSENMLHGYSHGFMSQETRRNFNDYELSLLLDAVLSGISITTIAIQKQCGLSRLSINLKNLANLVGERSAYDIELKRQKQQRNIAANKDKKLPVIMMNSVGGCLKEFESLTAATKYLGKKSSGSISNALNPSHPQRKAYGHLWKFK